MSDPYIGEITTFAGNFAPYGWLSCNGQSVSINTYAALYSILGTRFGGDGKTTFNLPNLNNNIVVGAGQHPGLANYNFAQTGGASSQSITPDKLPAHTHTLTGSTVKSTLTTAAGNLLGSLDSRDVYTSAASGTPVVLAPAAVSTTPASASPVPSIATTQPFLAMNYIIAWNGVYPTPD